MVAVKDGGRRNMDMDIIGTVNRLFLMMEYLTIVLMGLAIAARSEKPMPVLMPGEQCGGIIETGNQYKVSSAIEPPVATSAADTAHEEEDHHDVASYRVQYPANVSCTLSFRTDSDKQFFMRITTFSLEDSERCQNDVLLLYNGLETNQVNLIKTHGLDGLCGNTLSLPNYFYTQGNTVTLKFVTNDRDNQHIGFNILVTPFWNDRERNCSSEEFTCRLSGKCITKDAECNQEHQCEDGSDEPPNCVYDCDTCETESPTANVAHLERDDTPTEPNSTYPAGGTTSMLLERSYLGFFVALIVMLFTRPAATGGGLLV